MIKKITIVILGVLGLFLGAVTGYAESGFAGQRCPSDLILTQNLNAPYKGQGYIRNGKYNRYTRGVVSEAHILQKHLNRLGFNAGKVDGIIGPKTRGAILRMQKFLGTKQDGYVGPKTRKLLNNSCGVDLSSESYASTPARKTTTSKINNSWEKKYSKEDIELSRKAYTNEYAYSDYVNGDFSVEAKVKVNNKKTNEYLNANIVANMDMSVNMPDLEFALDTDFSYDVDTNDKSTIYDIEEMAKSLGLNYRSFMKGGLKLNLVVKDLDGYVKVSDIPDFYWNALEKEMGQINKMSKNKVSVRDFKRYEDKWIKIETPDDQKNFIKMVAGVMLPEIKKQALNQAKVYRERPFMIIDKSSKTQSGKYYLYNATVDFDNLLYVSKKTSNKKGLKISNTDWDKFVKNNEELMKNIKLKVYLDKKTDELRKVLVNLNLNIDEIEKDLEVELLLNLKTEARNISNTRKNNIKAPRNSEKWEDAFENIFGMTFNEFERKSREVQEHKELSSIKKVSSSDYILGNKKADIFIVEYSDLEGPFSKRFHNTSFKEIKEKYLDDGKVALVHRPFPLKAIHPNSFDAAVSAECVYKSRGRKGFFEFLEKIYSGDVKKHREYAEDFISKGDLENCISDDDAKEKIEMYFNDGVKSGIFGIPSVFIQLKDGSSFAVPAEFKILDQKIQDLI